MPLSPGFLDELRTRLSLSQVVGRKVIWDRRKCDATLTVNMRDIEPRKEDDGFDGAFLSP